MSTSALSTDIARRSLCSPCGRRCLIATPHPDDETIGAGATMAAMRDRVVVALTDGAPRDARLWGVPCASREEYARIRRDEMRNALAGLARVRPFDFVDLELTAHLVEATRMLARVIEEEQPELVITTPYEGGHPDHDAAAFIASAASNVPVVEMTSYHLFGGQRRTAAFVDDRDAVTEPVNGELKEKMFAAYASQREQLIHFPIVDEQFRFAPRYDFTRPPNHGAIWYEHLGWPFTALRFCEAARDALRELSCAS